MDKNKIAAMVRSKRTEADLTQKALGKLIGYEGRTAELMIQSIESGRRPVPKAKIKHLSEVLNINPLDLI